MKKQQVVSIHGAGIFMRVDRNNFEKGIIDFEIDLDWFRRKEGWKSLLQEHLGDSYDVLSPRMPHADDPRYVEWKAWFEKIIPFLDDEVIFIGHSLGGLFLAKYFSEETYIKKAKALFLVAAPGTHGERKEIFIKNKFALSDDVSRITNQASKVFVYHSDDDPIVSMDSFEFYKEAIPNANCKLLTGKKHFNGDNFPEIIDDIKSL